MKKYWVKWYSGYYKDEGCTRPPFQAWIIGYRTRPNSNKNDCIIYALINANNQKEVWKIIKKHFPDFKIVYSILVPIDYIPPKKFPNFKNKTNLYP